MRAQRRPSCRYLALLILLGLGSCLEWTSRSPVSSGQERKAASGQPADQPPPRMLPAVDSQVLVARPRILSILLEHEQAAAVDSSPVDGGVPDAAPQDAAERDAAERDAEPAPDVPLPDLYPPEPEPDLFPPDLQPPDLPLPPRADPPAWDLWPLGKEG